MEFGGRGNHDGVDVFVLNQSLRAAISVRNLKLDGRLACHLFVRVGDRHQTRFRNQVTQVLGVTPAHPSQAYHSNSQFGHRPIISESCLKSCRMRFHAAGTDPEVLYILKATKGRPIPTQTHRPGSALDRPFAIG